LGHSYDIKTVIDALVILKTQNITDLKFIIIGGGPLKEEFEKYAIQKEIQINFVGIKEYPEVVGMLSISDIAINPIIKGSVASIINKHADYAMAGLPVINTQESIEYRGLIEKFNCGINCDVGNAIQIADAIKQLATNENLRKSMGQNSRILAEQKFDRKTTYKVIENLILN
jgi:glycosyltransferase involved in cell wall biosynthesis